MKNRDNIQPAEKFPPPAEYDVYQDGKYTGTCRVYDAAAWRNQQRKSNDDTSVDRG